MRTVFTRLLPALCFLAGFPAAAATLSGVAMPDTLDAAGAHLVLNGMALRTYSILGLRIYVAGLYLDHRSSDADQIMASPSPKLLRFTFVRDVGQAAARRSWHESLQNSCRPPCQLPPEAVDRFLGAVPGMHAGDTSEFLFTGSALDVSMNGHLLGHVDDPLFMRVILTSFIGAHPTVPEVKRALLDEK